MLAWLTVVWVALWGDVRCRRSSAGSSWALGCLVFPLPPCEWTCGPAPARSLWLVVRFAADVVVASVQVAWMVLRRSRPLRNAVVEVNLRTPSDFVLTVVAEMVCLVPGSLVVEASRSTHTLFLHVLDVGDRRESNDAGRVSSPWRRVWSGLSGGTSPIWTASPPRPQERPHDRRTSHLRGMLAVAAVLPSLGSRWVRRCSTGSSPSTCWSRWASAAWPSRRRSTAHHHPADPPGPLPARVRRLGQRRALHPGQRRRRGGPVMSWTDGGRRCGAVLRSVRCWP